MNRSWLLAASFLWTILPAVAGSTITVDPAGGGDFTGIQEALDAAQAGDTVIVKPGEYLVAEPVDFNRVRADQGAAVDLTLRSEGGAEVTTIAFEEASPGTELVARSAVAFHVGETSQSLLDGFTLTARSGGSGIYCSGAAPTIKSCIVRECKETAVSCASGSPALEDCVITRNPATGVGSSGTISLTRCRIIENKGTAVSISGGSAEVRECEIASNWGDGAGISCDQGASVTVTSSMIVGNRGGDFGGGLYCSGAEATVVNCLVAGNAINGGGYGGAMCAIFDGRVRLVHCTIVDNYGYDRGQAGLSCLHGGTFETVNSIMYGNIPQSFCGTSDHTILESTQPYFRRRGAFDFMRFKDVFMAGDLHRLPAYVLDPGDYRLSDNSPAIDAGDPAQAPEGDIEGGIRPCGAAPDLGAYEFCGPPTIDCNENGTDDETDIRGGRSRDCNFNGVPDECDVRSESLSFSKSELEHDEGIESMAAADLDADGDIDLAVNTWLSVMSIFKNEGGALSFFWSPNAMYSHKQFMPGDMDGDRDVDLVTTNSALPEVNLFKNKGWGLFNGIGEPPGMFPIGGIASSAALADLDGDGDLDVATANTRSETSGPGSTVTIVSNTGGFLERAGDLTAGLQPRAIVAEDFTGDQLPDLAVSCLGLPGEEDPSLHVYLNRGDGTFESAPSQPLGQGPVSLAASDFDGDGSSDLVVASSGRGEVVVLWNDGEGTFVSSPGIPCGVSPILVVPCDLNGDGRPDLAIARDGESILSVLLNRGKKTFSPVMAVPAGIAAQSIEVADLDADGREDLILASQARKTIVVLRNQTPLPTSYDKNDDGIPDECPSSPLQFHRGDPNMDGQMDIADGVCILHFLFTQAGDCMMHLGSPGCLEAADANNDGAVNVSDAIVILHYLFLGVGQIAAPGPISSPCGEDPDPLGSGADLGCKVYDRC